MFSLTNHHFLYKSKGDDNMKLLFADGQALKVQAISSEDGKLHVSVLNNCYEQLKHLFTDTITTARIEVENDQGEVEETFENYTVFSYIKENLGKIFEVEMEQQGKDTETRLAEAEKRAEQAEKELTATQLALCEVYELLGQMQALLKPGEVDSNA